jgi:rhodanese-related sulfurtransferase
MKTIAPAQLHQLLKAQPDLQLLDVRTPVEYAEMHAHPVRNVPLESLGPEAVVVEGGTLAWNEAGLPVERGPVKVISLERQVRMTAGSLVLSGILLGSLVHRGFFGLSAFVGAGLVFAGITDFCGMGLLLSKPPWNTRKTV